MEKTEQIYEKFLDEYGSENAVRKYTTGTAGFGIGYLLRNDYARVYFNVVDTYLRNPAARPLRVLEFGCGGGMNIICLVSRLQERQVPAWCKLPSRKLDPTYRHILRKDSAFMSLVTNGC
jgi:hypothetical protein